MSSNTERYQHCLIYGTALVSVMGVASILPVLPTMAKDLQIADDMLGILIYSFTLPGIFLAPLAGILADRFGRKSVLFPCLILFAIGGFGASLTTHMPTFIFWRCIQGMGAAAFGVLYATIAGDIYSDDKKRLKIMGYAATVLSLGAAIFPALGGLLGEINWTWSLRLSLLALPLAWLTLKTPLPDPKSKANLKNYASTAKTYILNPRSILLFALTFCAFFILYGPLVSYFPLFSTTFYNISPVLIGAIFAISSIGTALVSLFLTPLTNICGIRILTCIGAVFFALSMLILLCWSTDWTYWLLTIPILCYGLGQGLLYPAIINALSGIAPHAGRGALMAVNGTILRLAQSVAPFICGILFLYGSFFFIFLLSLFICLGMFALAFLAFREQK